MNAHGFPYRRPGRLLAALLVFCLVIEPALGQLPELGDPSQAGLSPAKEKRIGEMAMQEIHQDPAYIDDPEVEFYLNSLGRKLVSASGFPPADFSFFALRDSTVNAFAMPGGYIGIHSGLVTTTQSESELAGVLSHEIGHVEQRHIARMLDKQSNSTALVLASFLVALLASGRGKSGGALGEAAIMSGQAAAIQNQLSFSQDFEREADRVGFQTLNAAGFDPQGMASFFDRLGKLMRQSERAETAFLRTHPLSVERLSDMQGRARAVTPRIVADSNEYVLIRAKFNAENGAPRDALNRIQSATAIRRQDQAARSYALARVWLRARNYPEAARALAQLRELRFESPFVEQLAADVAGVQGMHAEAARICREGLQRYPSAQYLLQCEVQALIDNGQGDEAARLTRDALVDAPKEERLYVLQAKAYGVAGKAADQQRALAELYVLQGNLAAAVEQLQLAQRSGGGDYYTQAGIDARLRELRAKLKDERANKLE